jgi:nucleoside 2-deoxyribosyltransferase
LNSISMTTFNNDTTAAPGTEPKKECVELMDPPEYRPIVYLAGKMTGLSYQVMKEWRITATTKLKAAGFRVIDPTDFVPREELAKTISYDRDMGAYNLTPSEIINTNIYHMRRADIILAEFNFEEISLGTVGEVIVGARELRKPVVAWGDNDAVSHAWINGHLTAHRLRLYDAIDFIIDVYRG